MEKCVRCGDDKKTTSVSFLNTDAVCLDCKDEEKKHPLYSYAKEIEHQEVLKGNYNYPGFFVGKTWEEIKKITTV